MSAGAAVRSHAAEGVVRNLAGGRRRAADHTAEVAEDEEHRSSRAAVVGTVQEAERRNLLVVAAGIDLGVVRRTRAAERERRREVADRIDPEGAVDSRTGLVVVEGDEEERRTVAEAGVAGSSPPVVEGPGHMEGSQDKTSWETQLW